MSVVGWCPGAWRPMPAGDGLILRIRPHASRLTVAQARGLAHLAECYGSGVIDLGSRAHLQLRGIRADSLPDLWQALADLALIDPDPVVEARRNILTTPAWQDDDTLRIAADLTQALAASGLELPPKFGFAVDTGAVAVLGGASADIRIERAARGLILRADGMARGAVITAADAAQQAVTLARWFAAHCGDHRRMAALIGAGAVPPLTASTAPLTGTPPAPGKTSQGLCLALPFGQMTADTLRHLAIAPLRLTPWRAVIVDGVTALPAHPDLIADPADPLLRVAACTGAPACAKATVATRDLARDLAPLVPSGAVLHLSGCVKGCAHPRVADITLTGRAGRFDLIRRGAPGDTPAIPGLSPDQLPAIIRGQFDPHL